MFTANAAYVFFSATKPNPGPIVSEGLYSVGAMPLANETEFEKAIQRKIQALTSFLQAKRVRELDVREVLRGLEALKAELGARPTVAFVGNSGEAAERAQRFCEGVPGFAQAFRSLEKAPARQVPPAFEIAWESEAGPRVRRLAEDGIVVGRGDTADAALPDARRYVSKRHAVVRARAGGVEITDHSRNGTWLNGRRMALGETATVREAATVHLGDLHDPEAGAVLALRPADGAPTSASQEADALVVGIDGTLGLPPEVEDAMRRAASAGRPTLVVGVRAPAHPSALPQEAPAVRSVFADGEEDAIPATVEWVRQATGVATALRDQGSRARYEALVDAAFEAMRECHQALLRGLEKERQTARQAKDRQEVATKGFEIVMKEAAEHPARLTKDLARAREEEFKELYESSLLSEVWKRLEAFTPCLEGKRDLDLVAKRWHSSRRTVARLRNDAAERATAWADARWEDLARRRRNHVARLDESLQRVVGGAEPLPTLEGTPEELAEEFRSIVERRVKTPALDSIERVNVVSVLYKGAMGGLTMASMLMFTTGRTFVGSAGMSEFRKQLPEYAPYVATGLLVLTVIAYLRHLESKAEKVRAALRKDFDAILEEWFDCFVKAIGERLDRHARLERMVLEDRLRSELAAQNAVAKEEASAAESRASDLQSKLRSLEYDPQAASLYR